jgi:hypothetical protein
MNNKGMNNRLDTRPFPCTAVVSHAARCGVAPPTTSPRNLATDTRMCACARAHTGRVRTRTHTRCRPVLEREQIAKLIGVFEAWDASALGEVEVKEIFKVVACGPTAPWTLTHRPLARSHCAVYGRATGP